MPAAIPRILPPLMIVVFPTVQAGGYAETRGLLAAMRPAVEQHLRMAERKMAGMSR